jgi:hypothetical protein
MTKSGALYLHLGLTPGACRLGQGRTQLPGVAESGLCLYRSSRPVISPEQIMTDT